MALYEIEDEPQLRAPVMVGALEGWVDAGSSGSTAAAELTEHAAVVATFDADAVFDYRVRRPTLDIVDGRPMRLEWATLTLSHARIADRDLLVLRGAEPDYRWHELAADIVALAKRFGVTSWVSLGSIPAAVPHTRPVPVLATASANDLLPDGIKQGPDGLLRVPAATLSMLEVEMAAAGIPAIGLFAQVPHYINASYPAASIALLTALGKYLHVDVPMGALATRALERRNQLDAAAGADADTKAHVERLELLSDQSRLPEGDELIADIERFLRDRGGDGEPEGGSGGGGRLH